jgi:hypothetical protein
VLLGLLVGCEALGDLLPKPFCEDDVEVDAVTGAAELVLDTRDCSRDGGIPDRAEYYALADADWEPLTAPDAYVCNTGSAWILTLDGVTPDALAVDPTSDPAYATGFVEGTWMRVNYMERNSSHEFWLTFFRFGHADEVVLGRDCYDDED